MLASISVKLWTISEDRDVTFTVFDGTPLPSISPFVLMKCAFVAHDDMVWDVSWSKGDPNIFSSVGQVCRFHSFLLFI